MNIFLIPYTMARHVVMSLFLGGAALIAWWVTLFVIVVIGPIAHDFGLFWIQEVEGAALLCNLSGVIAFMSVFAEGSLRRRAMQYRLGYALIAGLIAVFGTLLFYVSWVLLNPYLGTKEMRPVLEDPSLVTLRYKLLPWVVAGVSSGFGPFVARQGQALVARRFGYGADTIAPARLTLVSFSEDFAYHMGGGLVAGALCAAVWHTLGFYDVLAGDLYLASGLAALTWGILHGLLIWPIPDDMYAGWVRVLSAERFGLRIPVPHHDGSPAERFVGHFPRGLDLYLPAEQGVAELHASFVVDAQQQYAVRGLSVKPTVIKRFLERIDLRYDPRRPAPLETGLNMEDRVLMGPEGESEVEFLMLPREER